ncbi:MAG TPA: 4'-phosphopantetheinyl transferase superfamily protein [Gammaproteobacteria bacterium]|nr:4'-phosphopantetheinyl transferase superfamily protein [Gammaproteobacteria bacterium]
MNSDLIIEKHSVHLWQVFVPDLLAQLQDFFTILNQDEKERAMRFRFEEHSQRFIIARGVLRCILSRYTAIPAEKIEFITNARGKPYLKNNLSVQFNVSHSHDWAVYALTKEAEIGVDIEKIETHFTEGVARKFFSPEEYTRLMNLSEEEKIPAFYRLWAGKEAVIKALGEGLYAPLAEFSLDLFQKVQTLKLEKSQMYVEYFEAHPDYQSAFATSQEIKNRVFREWGKTNSL